MNRQFESDPNLPLDASIADLRTLWQSNYGHQPNPRWSRNFLAHSIAWQLQEARFGKMPRRLKSRLDRLADHMDQDPAYEPIFKPGTRLIRDWHGETHEVAVLDDGFAWHGNIYKSLSEIAREITGARWSGPRFFGLQKDQANAG